MLDNDVQPPYAKPSICRGQCAVAILVGASDRCGSRFFIGRGGALGTVLLINYSTMSPSQVVGTDILFGLVLALIGSAFHMKFGVVSAPILWQLLSGGVPGVLLGCVFARRVPARRLKVIIALIALIAGLQLVWNGTRTLRTEHTERSVGITSTKDVKIVSGK